MPIETCNECSCIIISGDCGCEDKPHWGKATEVGRSGLETGYKSDLIKHAAALLTGRLSDFREDYPKSVPLHVLKRIEKHNEKLRLIAIDLRRIANGL